MPSLTHVEAAARSALLDVHDYAIDLDLAAAADSVEFGCTVTITFGCREPGSVTFVELKPSQLDAATLNGVALDPAALVDNRLALSGLAHSNTLVLRCRMAYSNSGEGLHRFVDPEDGEVYLYGQSFLDDAQRIFGCFDQPDLKAPVTLRVHAPATWVVAANAPGVEVSPGRWEFERTAPLATYLVSLI